MFGKVDKIFKLNFSLLICHILINFIQTLFFEAKILNYLDNYIYISKYYIYQIPHQK